MTINCLQHVPFEGPALIGDWAKENGHELILTPLYLEEILPDRLSIDMLVIMGGPMGVNDLHEHPWLKEEKEYISSIIQSGIPTLGICLGAQLIAQVMGASVYHNTEKEIGWFPVKMEQTALDSPLFEGFPREITPLHWHGDTFDLPVEARLIGNSPATPHQGFYYDSHGEKVIALQFHLESTPHSLQELRNNALADLKNPGTWVQSPERLQENSQKFIESNALMKKILDNMVKHWIKSK